MNKYIVTISMAMIFACLESNAQYKNNSLIDTIKKYAIKTNSSDIYIQQNGKVLLNEIYEKDFQNAYVMSATKSIASLAIGILLTEGKLKSIDIPISQIFNERQDWKTGRKSLITVRHILSHTSGIETVKTDKLYRYGNCVEFALNSEVKFEPGTKWQYNNNAINLLSGIVFKLTNKSLFEYLKEKLFKPLGIKDVEWVSDVYMKAYFESVDQNRTISKKEEDSLINKGNNYAMDGLEISSADLVKIGNLLLNNGKVNGRKIVDKNWIKESINYKNTLNPTYGFSWWLIPDPKNSYYSFENSNLVKCQSINNNDTLITVLKECISIKYPSIDAFFDQMDAIALKYNYNIEKFYTAIPLSILLTQHVNGIIGFYAAGTNGNVLYILPKRKIVAARTISQERHTSGMHDGVHDDFPLLQDYLMKLK
ncbi:MAG: beta-lactamase family protein [Raineya sp.]|jgi:CubicO group peptidase (beta-lactamase class C family)|nr:beta-lactamase family protein [Raineya sp.]